MISTLLYHGSFAVGVLGLPRCLRAAALFLTSWAINTAEGDEGRRDRITALRILAGDTPSSAAETEAPTDEAA